MFLNVVVAATAMLMAWNGGIDFLVLGITLSAGALAVGGAGSINAFLDRNVDAAMLRTRGRPIPSGKIAPPMKALGFGAILIAVSLAIAAFLVNALTAGFIGLGVFFYLIVYTVWLKKRTIHNIVIGGFAGSAPALAGWAAATNSVGLAAVLLALLIFLWTPGHFWPLAMNFKDDYSRAGIPMLPTKVSQKTAARVVVASNLLVVAFTFTFFLFGEAGLPYLVAALVLGVWMIAVNMKLLKNPNATQAFKVFKMSSLYLLILLVALMVSSFWPVTA